MHALRGINHDKAQGDQQSTLRDFTRDDRLLRSCEEDGAGATMGASPLRARKSLCSL
jgi:hypothetical protein